MKILFFTLCTYVWAQSGVNRPELGKMLDSSGTVRAVYGITASVTLGGAETTGVLSSGCSAFCLVKTDSSLIADASSVPAPAGPAMFAFDGAAAFVWFPQSRQLAHWSNGALTLLDSQVDGEVLSIRASAGAVQFAIRRPRGSWIVNQDGSVADSLPRATGPVMLIAGGVVYTTPRELIVGSIQFQMEAVTQIWQMSASYLQVRAGGVDYALRIDPGHEALFQMPGSGAMKKLLLLAILPSAAHAQLVMYAVNGSTEASVGSTYQFGQVAIGTTSSVEFQIYNDGSAPVTVTTVTLGGAGFSFEYPVAAPFSIPAHSTTTQTLNVWISFQPTSTATFNASVTVSSSAGALTTILIGSGMTAPTLSSVSGCSSSVPFSWGSVPLNTSASCTFSLSNTNPQAVTVPSVVINGLGFTGPYGITTPMTLQPGQAVTFSVNFTPPAANFYSGTLVVGTQSFGLSATGQPALLPSPILQFDSASYTSGQQGVLTMTIPGGSPVAATGYVNLTFTPSTAVVKDDSAIVFLANGSRTIPFSVNTGATTVLLNGQSSATFQTGTTEGTITFAITTAAAISGASPVVHFAIVGTKVIIDSTSASKERLGYLDITISGADNTYSTGMMSFAFFDTSGNPIGSTSSADFSSTFKTYYSGDTAGSAFQVLVSFPVTGSVANIGSVTVTMTNAAGVASTGPLTFQ